MLDTAPDGRPAGVGVTLYRLGADRGLIAEAATNHDGRLDGAVDDGDEFAAGTRRAGVPPPATISAPSARFPARPMFVDDVVLRFGIADADSHYHVPLLVSPWSYSTYRGS